MSDACLAEWWRHHGGLPRDSWRAFLGWDLPTQSLPRAETHAWLYVRCPSWWSDFKQPIFNRVGVVAYEQTDIAKLIGTFFVAFSFANASERENAICGIRISDPSIRSVEDGTSLRPRGNWTSTSSQVWDNAEHGSNHPDIFWVMFETSSSHLLQNNDPLILGTISVSCVSSTN